MASVYKRPGRKGWYVSYKDENGRRRCVKGFTDKSETVRMATRLEEKAKRIRLGLEEAETDEPQDVALPQHIADFEKHLSNRETSEKRRGEVATKIRRIATEAGWSNLNDINATDVENVLGAYRTDGMSRQTSNHYLQAIKQLSRWLLRTNRLTEDPLTDLTRLNVQTDRRHDRRPLSPEEFERLVDAASQGKPVESIPGPDRAMMYVLSAWTGYRKGEIGSMTLRSLDLESSIPTATVQAIYSKREKQDVQVLHPDVVQRLKDWLATKEKVTKDQLLFPVSGKVPGGTERKTAKMMRKDLEAARKVWIDETDSDKERQEREASDFLMYEDSQGKFADFHANRHTFITNLGRGGVSPKTAQTLARHSDVRLTMNTYTHTDFAEKLDAVNRLPAVPQHRPIDASPSSENGSANDRRKNIGSAPKSQHGENGQPLSRDGETAKKKVEPKGSTEVVAVSEVDISCPYLSDDVESTPQRIRTSNLRFRRPMLYPIELGVLLPASPLFFAISPNSERRLLSG